jgi:hypothetical protein
MMRAHGADSRRRPVLLLQSDEFFHVPLMNLSIESRKFRSAFRDRLNDRHITRAFEVYHRILRTKHAAFETFHHGADAELSRMPHPAHIRCPPRQVLTPRRPTVEPRPQIGYPNVLEILPSERPDPVQFQVLAQSIHAAQHSFDRLRDTSAPRCQFLWILEPRRCVPELAIPRYPVRRLRQRGPRGARSLPLTAEALAP